MKKTIEIQEENKSLKRQKGILISAIMILLFIVGTQYHFLSEWKSLAKNYVKLIEK